MQNLKNLSPQTLKDIEETKRRFDSPDTQLISLEEAEAEARLSKGNAKKLPALLKEALRTPDFFADMMHSPDPGTHAWTQWSRRVAVYAFRPENFRLNPEQLQELSAVCAHMEKEPAPAEAAVRAAWETKKERLGSKLTFESLLTHIDTRNIAIRLDDGTGRQR